MILTLCRIYGEIGPGERVALSKLAIEKLEESGRPLRIAVDVSIWQFQIQAGQGGSSPAIRTFYYRLLRLLSVSVQPLFVFDGPHKPPFKRNKRSGHHGGSVLNLLCKQLLNLFGFPFHTAPGEAEAECALLQREGIVDAVLSEDVDTLMFGSGLTLRNWSSEGRGHKSPTHVSAYYAHATKDGKSGLDREGMILVALMSGGDYITEGIPGCGVKVACEAARAGFGKSLCQLSRYDTVGLDAWRKNLAHEIQTNESSFFRIKHKAFNVPDNFPMTEVLGYYTHPVVSSASKIKKLKDEIMWDGDIDIQGLRLFVAKAFNWTRKIGAKKFVRGLAPALLVHTLRLRGNHRSSGYDDVVLTAMNEMELVREICGKRTHFSTDGVPELRVVYHPANIVRLDWDAEEDDREEYGQNDLTPANGDEEVELRRSNLETRYRSASPSKLAPSVFDPHQLDKVWILETIAKVGIPLKVEDYEESLRNPEKVLGAKTTAKKAANKGGMARGAMDSFVGISKLGIESTRGGASKIANKAQSSQPWQPRQPVLPRSTRQAQSSAIPPLRSQSQTTTSTTRSRTRPNSNPGKKAAENYGTNFNPWTIALSSSPRQALSVTKFVPPSSKSEPTGQSPPHSDLEPLFNSSTSSESRENSTAATGQHPYSPQPESEPQTRAKSTMSSVAEHGGFHITTQSSGVKNRNGSHPKKKNSPLSPSTKFPPGTNSHSGNTSLASQLVNHNIDFHYSFKSNRPPSPEVPFQNSLSPIRCPMKVRRAEPDFITMSSSPGVTGSQVEDDTVEAASEVVAEKTNVKKYILLRESLPGAWKKADASEIVSGRSRAWRSSQVECLDLSAE
jgi:Holliday junction resolvase YEN1